MALLLGTATVWYSVFTKDSEPPGFAGDRSIAVFIGDSYTQGVGATTDEQRWSSLLAAQEGWVETNLGRGGTGYVATAGSAGCGLSYCPNYVQMIPAALDSDPNIVVVAGGQNDLPLYGAQPEAVLAQIEATFLALRGAFPHATIVAVGLSVPGEAGEGTRALDAAVRKAAESVDAIFVTLLDPPALTAEMVQPDGVHVDDAGHAAIAARVVQSLP